jgi:hypothetical protein
MRRRLRLARPFGVSPTHLDALSPKSRKDTGKSQSRSVARNASTPGPPNTLCASKKRKEGGGAEPASEGPAAGDWRCARCTSLIGKRVLARCGHDLFWHGARVLSRDPHGQLLVQWDAVDPAAAADEPAPKAKKRPKTDRAQQGSLGLVGGPADAAAPPSTEFVSER